MVKRTKRKPKKGAGRGRGRGPSSREAVSRELAAMKARVAERDQALAAIREQVGPYLKDTETMVGMLEATIAENERLRRGTVRLTPIPQDEADGHPWEMFREDLGVDIRRHELATADVVMFMHAPSEIDAAGVRALEAMVSSFSERTGVQVLPVLVTGERRDLPMPRPILCAIELVDPVEPAEVDTDSKKLVRGLVSLAGGLFDGPVDPRTVTEMLLGGDSLHLSANAATIDDVTSSNVTPEETAALFEEMNRGEGGAESDPVQG